MEPIVERCCGLDVHQASVVACLLVGRAHERPRKEVRTFSTFTADLVAMRDWLQAEGVTQVGMESTGVYWKPVYTVLEEAGLDLIVGNAHHIRNVPGRKTDVKDSEWIADLVRHGLIAKSFVPPKPIRELRDLVRYRRKLVESQTAEKNRLLKLLECANIKLASVASDVFGVSGALMLEAIIQGEERPEQMAELARGRLRPKRAALARALEGRVEGGRVRRGNVLLRTSLVEAATAAACAKGTYLRDKFFRLKARRGYKRAAMAIAHKILIAAYHMLATGQSYRDLGESYLDHLGEKRITGNLTRRLERLGYVVHLERRAS